MKFPEEAPVTLQKRQALKDRILRLGIVLPEVQEQAIKSGGPGGQKVNKTSSGVLLRYTVRDELIVVKWSRERHHALNRFLALRELVDEVEAKISPETSDRVRERTRIRRQKDRAKRRGRARQMKDPERKP